MPTKLIDAIERLAMQRGSNPWLKWRGSTIPVATTYFLNIEAHGANGWEPW